MVKNSNKFPENKNFVKSSDFEGHNFFWFEKKQLVCGEILAFLQYDFMALYYISGEIQAYELMIASISQNQSNCKLISTKNKKKLMVMEKWHFCMCSSLIVN